MTRTEARTNGIWRGPLLRVSVGAVALVFLAAMQTLAVTTVMPVVSADLNGEHLYAVAFAATLAASVVGMVGTGAWSDRSGPTGPLSASVALFVVGLIACAAAPGMELFVGGRLIQGLGAGGITVALYVVVARRYPADLHARVFAAFSAAWVVPSLVGPFAAGAVAEYLHWRWVFVGVAVLAVAAFALLAGRLTGLDSRTDEPAERRFVLVRLAAAIVAALALLVLGLAGGAGVWALPLVVASLVAVVLAARRLLPRGTLVSRPGLPSVVLMRGVLAGAFFSAEVYIPLFFVEQHGFTVVWAGLALTLGAIAWAIASDVQGRAWRRWPDVRVASLAAAVLTFSIAVIVVAAATVAPPVVLIGAWALGAGAMGLVFPRLSVLTLAYSTPADQGENSAALSISDAVGAAASIAVLGLVFAAAPHGASFAAVFGTSLAVAAVAIVPARRLRRSS